MIYCVELQECRFHKCLKLAYFTYLLAKFLHFQLLIFFMLLCVKITIAKALKQPSVSLEQAKKKIWSMKRLLASWRILLNSLERCGLGSMHAFVYRCLDNISGIQGWVSLFTSVWLFFSSFILSSGSSIIYNYWWMTGEVLPAFMKAWENDYLLGPLRGWLLLWLILCWWTFHLGHIHCIFLDCYWMYVLFYFWTSGRCCIIVHFVFK